jgi:hypothetical protein
MSTKITIAAAAAVIPCAFPALAAGNGTRDNRVHLQVRSVLHTAI